MTSLDSYARQDLRPPRATKQWNRTDATKRLGEEMTRAQAEAGYEFSILLVEFEGLGDSTDRLGYASGQDVWRRAMNFLSEDMRVEDLCCRLSGDEFLLIMSARGEAEARNLIAGLRRRWRPTPEIREAGVSLNIGLASYPAHGCRIEELLCAADEALHLDRTRNEMINSAEARRSQERQTAH